ncbi:MAG TPA: hypothetical protein DER07_07605, partial [Armatimonadetes bacterium]|nr:hypothetical protein [Armatimonadota bacterium]
RATAPNPTAKTPEPEPAPSTEPPASSRAAGAGRSFPSVDLPDEEEIEIPPFIRNAQARERDTRDRR